MARPKIPGVTTVRGIPATPGGPDTRGVGESAAPGIARMAKAREIVSDKKNRNSMAKADADMSIALTGEKNAYDQDTDYGSIESRFSGNVESKMGEIASTISDANTRNAFVNKWRPQIASGREQMVDLAFGKEKDFERGELSTRLEATRNAAILSGDIGEANNSAMELLDSHRELGHIDHEESVKLRDTFRNSVSKGYIEAQEPEDRVKTLSQPWAKKHLPPDLHASLKRKAEDELRIGKAQAQVDEYLDVDEVTDIDRDEVMANIEKKYAGKPDLRQAVEERFEVDFARAKKGRVEEQSQLFDKYFLDVRSGELSVNDMMKNTDMRAELERMSPEQQNSLFSAEKSSVSATKVPFNINSEDRLNYLYKTKQFPALRKYYVENAGSLSDSQNKSWSSVSVEGVVPIEVESLFTAKASLEAKTPGYSKEKQAALKEGLDDWYRGYQEREQRIPTDDIIDKQIDRLILEHPTTGWFMGRDRMPAFKMTPEESNMALDQARKDDEGSFNDAAEYFRMRKMQPDHAAFLEVYDKLRESRNAAK